MSERNGDRDILDRATDALRNEPVPPVPADLMQRTQFAVRGHAAIGNLARTRSPFRHPLVRIAAAIGIVTCGAAVYFAATLSRGPVETAQDQPRPGGPEAGPDQPEIVAPPDEPGPAPVAVDDDRTVHGRVRFAGPVPRVSYLSMADNAHCAVHHDGRVEDESVVVNADGTLRNVVVWVSRGLEGKEFKPPAQPAVLDQEGCVFAPHVVTVMTGQRLLVKNSDPFLHNVRAAASVNSPFNFGQPTVNRGTPIVFDAPERLLVKCDVHPWMSAFILVMDHPFFAVTGDRGAFALPPGLPPGDYEVSAWHEVYGEQTQTVHVKPGQPMPDLSFTFKPRQDASATRSGAEVKPACCKKTTLAPTLIVAGM